MGADDVRTVTLIPGDGIGPEVVGSARRILEAAGAPIEWEECEAGAEVFKRRLPSGVPAETIESISRTRVVLKGPLETPVGFGEKSANVTLRKLFETYANVRPARELPGVSTPYSGRGIDLVVVRENVEDLYAGIEYMQTPGVAEALKLISRKGCEKVARFAFELARAEGRRSVVCATKANIMKLTEGMMKRTFEEVAADYPDVESWHLIVDNCAHQLVKRPEQFDVIVTTNMNGDILSDESSALVGGLGFAPSGNFGDDVAIFEAVHGSAPKYAGKDVINPTALILSAVMMLRHLGMFAVATDVEHAVLVTLESGVRTGDIVGYDKGASTTAYTDAIISNLGKRSERWQVRDYRPIQLPRTAPGAAPDPATRAVVGVDVFVEASLAADELGKSLEELVDGSSFALKMIGNRGTMVYPPTGAITDLADHWRCRFVPREEGSSVGDEDVLDLLRRIGARHAWMHVEKLQTFQGEQGFTRDQGEN
ncbi:MAG TPA: NADP-dependent isocitrate dehydrogenase [Actinomycetota bacterium]|nr:NADP-dependent isocitrate dehydrogenase [Actinomycetota bacterium]